MDYKAINHTINRYFDGISTLDEERLLKQYFNSAQVHPEHMAYKPLFEYYMQSQNISNPKNIKIPYRQKRNHKLAIAAVLVLGIGLLGLSLKNKHHKQQQIVSKNISPEKEKQAYKEIKRFSNSINNGVRNASALSIFGKATNRIFNINETQK